MSLSVKAQGVLQAALDQGGQFSELFLEESRGLAVVMDDNKVEKVVGGVDAGAGLRLISDLRTAYAYGNDLSEAGLLPLARKVAALGQGPAPEVAEPKPGQPGWRASILKPPAEADLAYKVEMVRAANAAARDYDPRVRQVRVIFRDSIQRVRIVNSLGQEAYDERVQVVLVVNCVAEEKGLVQTGYESAGGHQGMEFFEETDPQEVARQAARRAVGQLSADPAPGGAMAVVLHSSAGGTMIHEAVGHGLEGDLVFEKQSVYAGKLGQKVASELITVVDDATLPGKRGSFGFDDEGVPSRRNLVIDRGVLKAFLHDRLSALKMDQQPTGNGRRQDYRHRPVPRMTNTFIAPGGDDPEAIIADTPQGLLVKKMGGGQVNTVNGDFVFEVSEGYLLAGGKVGPMVRGATLTGNGPQVLREIDRVGSDLGFGIGTCGKDGQGAPIADAQPTLRIPRIVVGGLHRD